MLHISLLSICFQQVCLWLCFRAKRVWGIDTIHLWGCEYPHVKYLVMLTRPHASASKRVPTCVIHDHHQGAGRSSDCLQTSQNGLCRWGGKNIPHHSSGQHSITHVATVCWFMTRTPTYSALQFGPNCSGDSNSQRQHHEMLQSCVQTNHRHFADALSPAPQLNISRSGNHPSTFGELLLTHMRFTLL